MTKFTTGGEDGTDGDKHVGDDYFLNSSDKIRFFFEAGIIPLPAPPPHSLRLLTRPGI